MGRRLVEAQSSYHHRTIVLGVSFPFFFLCSIAHVIYSMLLLQASKGDVGD